MKEWQNQKSCENSCVNVGKCLRIVQTAFYSGLKSNSLKKINLKLVYLLPLIFFLIFLVVFS